MTSLPDAQVNISSTVSHSVVQRFTTMPSHVGVRNPQSRLNPPHPRPTAQIEDSTSLSSARDCVSIKVEVKCGETVSLDPRPVVIPIISSVIGFPILVFALICALRHRAIKLRRRDHLKKLQAGVRSVTLDLPPREKISYFSGGSSPEISMKEVGDRLEAPPPSVLKSSLHNAGVRRSNSTSKNNNHVKFVTPPTTLEASQSLQVDVVLHSIERLNGSPWKSGNSSQNTIEGGVTVHMEDDPESSR